MRAMRVIAVAVLLIVAFLIVYPPLANGGVNVVMSSSSRVTVEHLYVTIGEIRAHRADTREPEGWFMMSNQSSQVDLAAVNSTQIAGLGQVPLGQYDMIRLRITNATAVVNDTSKRVQLPSNVFTVQVSFLARLGVQTVITMKVVPELQETPELITLSLSFTIVPETGES